MPAPAVRPAPLANLFRRGLKVYIKVIRAYLRLNAIYYMCVAILGSFDIKSLLCKTRVSILLLMVYIIPAVSTGIQA